MLAHRVASRMLDQIVKLKLNSTVLDEVYVIDFVAKVVNVFSWFKCLFLEVLTHLDDFSQRPVAHYWNFLKQIVT